MPVAAFDPTTHNSTTATHSLGQEYTALFNGERAVFRFVKVVDATAAADGDVMLFASASTWSVTKDISGGSAVTTLGCAGVAVGTISQDRYGFILIRGRHDAVKCHTSTAVGEYISVPGASDGTSARVVAAGDPPTTAEWTLGLSKFGMALGSGSGGTVAAVINCM